ncbi:MAG: aminomethyltransferase beta-barrel domain-containing protein [Pseudomonadota bacterium]
MQAAPDCTPDLDTGGSVPGADQPGGEQPGGEQPGGEQAAAEVPDAKVPDAEVPGGEVPGGDAFDGYPVRVRVRSTRAPVPARLHRLGGGRARLTLLAPEEGVAPGQAGVLYAEAGTRVLGGGWILRE